jgi:large subunit ribosomal protein L13
VKTYATKASDIERKWYVVDATNQTLGRLASQVARILIGKHKPYFSPNMDTGDYVIIINAEKIRVTGRKLTDKQYYRHSGFPGGIKSMPLEDMLAKHPDRVLTLAIKNMLPHNRLGRQMMGKLKVYAGPEHPHEAQQPEQLSF